MDGWRRWVSRKELGGGDGMGMQGDPPAAKSYLVMDKILAACEATGADAVSPACLSSS